jgi:hypothetical protein
MAIRSEAAIKRIEAKVIGEWGVKSAPLPTSNRDKGVLHCNQLERIADMLDAVERFQAQQADPRLQAAIELVNKVNWTKAELEAILLETD